VIVQHPETVGHGPQLFQTFSVHRGSVIKGKHFLMYNSLGPLFYEHLFCKLSFLLISKENSFSLEKPICFSLDIFISLIMATRIAEILQ